MRLRLFAAAMLVVGAAACVSSDPPTSPAVVQFTATPTTAGLVLANSGTEPVFYLVFDGVLMPLIMWTRCTDPAFACPRVAGHASVVIPWADITAHGSPGTEYVFSAWRLVPVPNGTYEIDPVLDTMIHR